MPDSFTNVDFAGASKLLETGVQLIKTLADGLRVKLIAGQETVDVISARKAESRLKNLYLLGTNSSSQQGVTFLPAAEEYVRVPTIKNWTEASSQIRTTLEQIEPLAKELLDEKSEFVLDGTYESLVNEMRQREPALKQVLELPSPPSPAKEAEALSDFLKKYVVLVRELQNLNYAVASFLRGK